MADLSERMQKYLTKRQDTLNKQAFNPSPQQKAYFDWIVDGKGNLILRAAAGTGKTTTLIEGLRLMSGTIFFGAYNKDIAAEIKAKATEKDVARSGMFISTLHGAGYNDFMRVHKHAKVDDGKVRRIIDGLELVAWPHRDELKAFIGAMVSFGKQFLAGVKFPLDNMKVWYKLMEHFSADLQLSGEMDPYEALTYVVEVFKRSHKQCPELIDFDDMIYAPIAYKIRSYQNDWVLIDEAQDINPARRELAKRMLNPNGRFVAVGDDRQAIYGFTGAGGNAIEIIKQEFNCAELPLSVTYRCPKAVVQYAYKWVPESHIQAHESAPEGVVRAVLCASTPEQEGGVVQPWFIQDKLEKTDVVLCRYNAPLIKNAFALIREGIPCKVAGRDIGKGLITLARTWKIKTLVRLEERLKKYLENELVKAAKLDSESRAQEVTDKVECLRIFIDRCKKVGKHTIDELAAEIEAVFADKIEGMITFSSGHKAKGREWTRVFWIQTAQRKRPNKAWEAEQEENIQYVIATRAKSELILVPEMIAG